MTGTGPTPQVDRHATAESQSAGCFPCWRGLAPIWSGNDAEPEIVERVSVGRRRGLLRFAGAAENLSRGQGQVAVWGAPEPRCPKM